LIAVLLLTPAEMSESILFAKSAYAAKSGLDPNCMKIFKGKWLFVFNIENVKD
jgi:hypothetical protein